MNILAKEILNVLAERLMFYTDSLFSENVELVNFHRNRLIDIFARAHQNRLFVLPLNLCEGRRKHFRSHAAEKSNFFDEDGRR